jgi:hypothetical protein
MVVAVELTCHQLHSPPLHGHAIPAAAFRLFSAAFWCSSPAADRYSKQALAPNLVSEPVRGTGQAACGTAVESGLQPVI